MKNKKMTKKIIHYNSKLKKLAQQLRKQGSLAEVILWKHLKNKQMLGYDFHRQKPIDNYIIDFFCPQILLAIEIDGSSHNEKYDSDLGRQKRLESLGIQFLRFSESEVRNNLEGVLITIKGWIVDNTPRPSATSGHPSLEGIRDPRVRK